MNSRLNLVYSVQGGIPLRFDYFIPQAGEPLAMIVCIHGGGWISGQKEDMHDVARSLVKRGYAAACPEYRLAPLHHFPAAVKDVQEFVSFARQNDSELGIDANRIGSLGISAGGHLSAMLAVTEHPFMEDLPVVKTRVNAAVAICPLTDITDPVRKHYPISVSFIEQFMGVPYSESPQSYEAAGPMHYVDAQTAPMLIVHGESDDIVPVTQSDALDAMLDAKGVPHRYLRLTEEGHSFSVEAWETIEAEFLRFFAEHLASATVRQKSHLSP